MKKLVLKIPPLLLLLVMPLLAHLQTINTTAGSVTSCPGQILVPIEVTNFNDIGGVSLVLAFNPAVLTYDGYQDVHAALAGGEIAISTISGKVYIVWANGTGVSFGNGILLKLKFLGVPGNTSLSWDTQTPGYCEYVNSSGSIVSASFTNGNVTIQQPPVINTHPVNKTVLVNQSTTFSFSAAGTNLTYKWYLSINSGTTWTQVTNGGGYSGAATANLNISVIPLSFNGYLYRCEVSGTCTPPVTSSNALLTVIKPLITSFSTIDVCPGNILIPVLTSNFTNVAGFSLVFSYNPAVLTYNGYQNLNAFITPANFVCNALNGKVYMSWASGTAVNFSSDTTLIKIKFIAATGSTNLQWNTDVAGNCEYVDTSGEKHVTVFQNATFSVHQVPVLNTHPANKLVSELTNTSFNVSASATGIMYQWQVSTNGGSSYSNVTNGGGYSGATTATLSITGATLTMNGYLYRCVISGTCSPSVTSDPALLTVLPKITTTAGSIIGCPGNTLIVPVNVQRFVDVASFSLTLAYNPAVLTYTGYQSLNAGISPSGFVASADNGQVFLTWYSTSAVTIGNALLLELKFTGNTGLSTLNWNQQTPGGCEYSTASGQIIFTEFINGNVTVNQSPVINIQPVNKTIYAGGGTSFSVGASGTSLYYQWQVSTNGGSSFNFLTNSPPYSGVYTANLSINPVATGQNGYLYRCYVTGSCTPYLYSEAATLTVIDAAVTATIGNVSNSCTGNINVPVNLTNCVGIGGISLVLEYDTTKMLWAGYHSLNEEVTNGMLVINGTGNKVIFSWASLDPAEITNGILVQYRFIVNANVSSTIAWSTQTSGNCEFSKINGLPITAFFVNGTVSTIANALVVNAGADVVITPGSSAQLEASRTGGVSPFTIAWTPATGLSDPNILNPIATPGATTTYKITVSGNNGCVAWDEVTVTVDSSLPEDLDLQNITVSNSVCYNASQTITVAGNGSYFTAATGSDVTFLAGQNILFLPGTSMQSGSHVEARIVTNGIYCAGRSIVDAGGEEEVTMPESLTLVGDQHEPDVVIYPNPSNGIITIQTGQRFCFQGYNLELISIFGEIVRKEKHLGKTHLKLDLSNLPKGMYFARIFVETDMITLKILLQ